MAEKINKNNFIEIEYTGRVKGGEIFDTNVEEEAKKLNPNFKVNPLVICIGQNMILPAIDEFLTGKETEKIYTLELDSEKAFGIRRKELIKTMPLSIFNKDKISPQQGMVFAFDNLLGRISKGI
ncbi:MAG: FKBP-type peptidyl-prolyl cis-trans isomerase [Nanoarchaeota archaeon]